MGFESECKKRSKEVKNDLEREGVTIKDRD